MSKDINTILAIIILIIFMIGFVVILYNSFNFGTWLYSHSNWFQTVSN